MGGKIMAGGDYEIEIFGKRLRYSEAKLRELRLGNFFYELQSMESERVEMLFRVAGDFDGLLKLEVEKIMELYILMYENVYKKLKFTRKYNCRGYTFTKRKRNFLVEV